MNDLGTMKRRDFLKTTAVTAVAGTALVGCGGESEGPAVQTQPTVRWQLASSYTQAVDILWGNITGIAERVSQLTDGKFQIRPFQGGEIVPGQDVLDAVQKGTVQAGQTASYYYKGKNPVLAFDTAVPFGLTPRQHNAWMYHGGGNDLIGSAYADFNVLHFPCGNTGAQMGGWFRPEINSLADLRGLKMRIPGLGGEVMSRLGVTVQMLNPGEIYTALERGALDAAEWVGPYDDEKLGFHKITRNYYYPGWWEPSASIALLVNRQAYDALPPTYQEALATAAAEGNSTMLARYDARNTEALVRLLDQGVTPKAFPDDLMEASLTTAREVLAEQAAALPEYATVLNAYRQWRTESFRWFTTAEQTYARFLPA